MKYSSMIERLALPMFICGVMAMVASATISLGTSASATNPIDFKKVTLSYLSSGYSNTGSSCGSVQDIYSGNSSNSSSFRSQNLSNSSNNKTFECTATFYVVSNVVIPTPEPIPTVTVIYSPQTDPTPRPSSSPTRHPQPTPKATNPGRPAPYVSPTPRNRPNWWQRPAPTPTKLPRP
jgi:hypothetical protein